MLRLQVYLPENLFLDLKSRAVIEETSMAEIIRRGLRKIINLEKSQADPLRVFVGKCRLKSKTNSVKTINDYYQKTFK